MGGIFTRVFDQLGKKEYRVLLLGLDGAGKTTTLYKLKLGEVACTVPTIGFNVESVQYRGVSFKAWDVGGQQKLRHLWKYYYKGTNAIIFIVDSCDTARLEEAHRELEHLLTEPELAAAKLLVFANKQDMQQAQSVEAISKSLGLPALSDRQWHIQGCSAVSGDGLFNGLDWMVETLKGKKSPRRASK